MADKKISALTGASTPLAGTEVLPIVQSGSTVKVSVANLTAGRTTAMSLLDVENAAGGGVMGTFKSNWSNTKVAVEGDGATGAGVLNISNPAATAALPFKVKLNGTEVIDVDTSGNAKATIGNFVVGTAGKGIDFSANPAAPGMTSELLNDYEEGTWTPSFSDSGGGVPTQTSAGRYVKVGSVVHFWFQCTFSAPAVDLYYTTAFPFTPLTTTSGGSAMLSSGTAIYPVLGIDDGRLRAFVTASVTTFYGSGSIRV